MDFDIEDGELSSSSGCEEDIGEAVTLPEEKAKPPPPKSAEELGEFEFDVEIPPYDDDFDYKILERPKLITREVAPVRPISSASQNFAIVPPPQQQQQDEYNTDDDEKSSEDSDSDDEKYNFKRHRMEDNSDFNQFRKNGNSSKNPPPSITTTLEGAPEQSTSSAFQELAGAFQKTRKVNNIWSNVLFEDKVSETFNTISVQPGALADRGSESYYRINPRKRMHRLARKEEYEADGNVSDSSSISCSGISEYSYKIIKETENEQKEMSNEIEGEKPKVGAGKRDWKKLGMELRAFPIKQLADYVAKQLQEPKKSLVTRSIEYLGRNIVTKLFIKTQKILSKGGIYVVNRSRKRTPGGIFFYLLRGYPGLDASLVDRVFSDEVKGHPKQKMPKKKYKIKGELVQNVQELQKQGEGGGGEEEMTFEDSGIDKTLA